MNLVVSIVGFGNIGKLICALLVPHRQYHLTINIIDVNPDVSGAITDFEHGLQLHPHHSISYNSTEHFNNSDFIFHCAGASVPQGESRFAICNQSVEITEAIFKDFKPSKVPFIIVVANPVEIIAHITHKITGLPRTHIIGTGTFLDSIRMNQIIQKMNPALSDIDAILLGEHGATTFLSHQLSTLNGIPFGELFDADTLNQYLDSVKNAAKEIKVTQRATMYGVSYCAIRIFELLLTLDVETIPISILIPETLRKELDVPELFLSLSATINHTGAVANENYTPNSKELSHLKKSADLILSCMPIKYI